MKLDQLPNNSLFRFNHQDLIWTILDRHQEMTFAVSEEGDGEWWANDCDVQEVQS